jgi:uncharacterized phage infection (PIP) family protein YhgE
MFKSSVWLAAFAAVVLVTGCSNMKEPANQAVASAETALASIRDDAAKYAPEALQPVETQVADLKANLAKGDYKAVMAAAPNVTSAISSLRDTVSAKKSEMEAAVAQAQEQWAALNTDVPQMISAIQSRVDILSRSKKLPKGLDKSAFESAKSGFDAMKADWTAASSAFTAGNVTEAVDKAETVKAKGAEVMRSLGMTSG